MGACDYLIMKDIVPSCEDPVTPGFEQEGVLLNRSEIDFGSVVVDSTRNNVIKTLAMQAGKRGYKIKVLGSTPFNGTKSALATGTYRNTFTHDVQIAVLANDPDVCENLIDGLANGKFVIVLENTYKSLARSTEKGFSAFQIYGYHQGLAATALDNDKYSEETEGGWLVTLQETKSPKSGMFLFNTDYETTKKQFESLTEAAE